MSQIVDIKASGDAAWPELDPANDAKIRIMELQSEHLQVAFLDNGTTSGNPVVLVRSDTDGTAYVLQFTAKQFQAIAAALRGKYGEIQ
jgi:hypothetical protein